MKTNLILLIFPLFFVWNEVNCKPAFASYFSTQKIGNQLKIKINHHLLVIDDTLNKSKQGSTSVNGVDKKNKELQEINSNLTIQNSKQKSEIISLRIKLNLIKIEMDQLILNSIDEQKEKDHKAKLLSKVYCAIGTFKDLKKSGLIRSTGEIAIEKTPDSNPDIDKEMFSVLDMNEIKEISISADDIKLISLHPPDSYKFKNTTLTTKTLVILDSEEFWSVSKYLILQVSLDKPLLKKKNHRKFEI